MAITQTTYVLNDFGLARRDRTTSRGTSSRYTVSIDSQPLILTFDPKALGAGPAQAIADHLRTRIQAISQEASASTQLQRKYAGNAYAAGKSWAMKRYAGGKTGGKVPNQSSKLFNDSGRFAEGIVAGATRDGNWTINVTKNRLDPATFKDGEAGVVRMVERLRQLVPEFGDATKLVEVPAIKEAIFQATRSVYGRQAAKQLENDLKSTKRQVGRAVLGIARSFL